MGNIEKTPKVELLNIKQICSIFKITKYYKIFVEKKYKGKKMTLKEWESALNKDGLQIKK